MSDSECLPASDSDQMISEYRKYTWRKVLFIIGIAVGVFILFGLSLSVGKRSIDFVQVYSILWDHITGVVYPYQSPEWWDDSIIWNTRLPRAVLSLIVGAGLAACGCAMQSVLKNPLADPYSTGVSSAASFGVAVALFLGLTIINVEDQASVMVLAFIFGLIPAIMVSLLTKLKVASVATIILAGVAISYFFNGLRTLLMTFGGEMELSAIFMWQLGSFQGKIWSDIPIVLATTILGTLGIMLIGRKLNLMALSDENAQSMGVDINMYRMITLLVVSLITAVMVSIVGIIGFVGLVTPHIVRTIIGSDNKYLVPASIAFGMLFVLFGDVMSRMISPVGEEIPVGVVMSFIGGPIFLYYVIKMRRDLW